MKIEGCYVVNLQFPEQRQEIYPWMIDLIDKTKQGLDLTNIRGFALPGHGRKSEDCWEFHDTGSSADDIHRIIDRYVNDMDAEGNYGTGLHEAVETILFHPDNPEQAYPVDPILADGWDMIMEQIGPEARQILNELDEYSLKEEMFREVEHLVYSDNDRLHIAIVGNLAAGKTTFLHTIEQLADMARVNRPIRSVEPEDVEDEYPDLSTIYHYRYSRISTRGREATLGFEQLSTHMYLPHNGPHAIVPVTIEGSGGHVRADQIDQYNSRQATAFFLDFGLMKQLVDLDTADLSLDYVFSNHETLQEVLLSLSGTFEKYAGDPKRTLGIISKLPKQIREAEVMNVIADAFDCVNRLILDNHRQLQRALIAGTDELTLAGFIDPNEIADEWMYIHDDYPRCTGSIPVLQRLVEMAASEKRFKAHDQKLVRYNEKGNNKETIYFEDLV